MFYTLKYNPFLWQQKGYRLDNLTVQPYILMGFSFL